MTGTSRELPRLYTAAEVAEALRRSPWWVKDQARRRRIPHCLLGGSYLFTEEHVVAIVRVFEVQPIASADPAPRTSVPVRPVVAEAGSSADGPVRLHARPPRRLRGTHQTAA
jgi:hypothetical protein